ncbi:hypothetical protein AAMO2058_000032400 [Amorphochlora amoebiformis]
MIHPSHEMIVLGLLSLFATATGTEVKQNTSIEEVGNLKRCPKIRLPCSWSKKCFSFSAVKKLHYISPDNLKGPENFRNFSALREKMKSKHLRIRAARHWFGIAGFFTYPTYVINQLLYAEKLGLIGDKAPFVYMPETHHYFTSCTEGGKPGREFYSQWFEPISNVKYTEVKETDIWEFSQLTIESIHHNRHVVHSYPYQLEGNRITDDTGTHKWITCMRARARGVIEKYISIKPSLLHEANRISRSKFGTSPVIGVHMRGTDKWINKQVHPLRYIVEIEDFLKANPNGKIFLATDDSRFLAITKEKFPELVAIDAMRKPHNIIFDDKVDKNQKTKDVLIDSLVLASSATLVKSWSAVSEFSVYFHMKYNKKTPLTVVDLQLNKQGKKIHKSEICDKGDISKLIRYRPHKWEGKEVNISTGTHHNTAHRTKIPEEQKHAEVEVDAKTGCPIATPRIRSMPELRRILKTVSCSRMCTAFRTRRMGTTPHSNMTGSKTIVAVIGHYHEKLHWASLQPICYISMEKYEHGRSLNGTDPSVVTPNKANADSSFLKFFVEAYSFLPDSIITTHGDRFSQHSPDLVPMLRHINPDSYEYASLNGIYFHMIDLGDYCSLKGFYDTFITNKSIYPPFPRDFMGFSLTCCSQYIVSKERVLARPLIEYKKLYNFAIGSPDWGHGHGETIVNGQDRWTGYTSMIETGSKSNLPAMLENKVETKPFPSNCPAYDSHDMLSFSRGESMELFWHVLFGESWEGPKKDAKQLCGSDNLCSQDWPIIQEPKMRSISKYTPGIVENPKDAFWYPAVQWQEITDEQQSHVLGRNFLISTPMNLTQLDETEEKIKILKKLPIVKKSRTSPPGGFYDLSVDYMDDERIQWMADLMANETIEQPENINILLYNDDPCGIDFFGLRVEPYLKFKGCGTPVRLYSSRHRSLIDQMDIVIVSQGWSERDEGFNSPDLDTKRAGQLWMSCTIENGKTYPRTPIHELKKRFKIDKIIGPSLHDADMYVSFYSQFYTGAEAIRSQLRGIKPMPHGQKLKKIAIMNAACFGQEFSFRNNFVQKLVDNEKLKGRIASMGRCWHNEEPRLPWVDDGVGNRPMAFHMNKLANIRPYMFTLCHESVDMDGWVTEKVFHALAMGSIPIYRGSKNIKAYVPCKHCVIDARDFKTIDDLATHINEIIEKRKLYNSYHVWRSKPYDKSRFPVFENKIRKGSIDTAICRIASEAKASAYRKKALDYCEGECLEEVYKLQRLAPHG